MLRRPGVRLLLVPWLAVPLAAGAHTRAPEPDWAAIDAYVEAQRSSARIRGIALDIVRGPGGAPTGLRYGQPFWCGSDPAGVLYDRSVIAWRQP